MFGKYVDLQRQTKKSEPKNVNPMKKTLLLFGMLALSCLSFAQVSKQKAIQIVMDSIVGSDSTRGCVGKMQQYRPISRIEHEENTKRLLETLTRHVTQFHLDLSPIVNLSAEHFNGTTLLTWNFPETYQPEEEIISWSGDLFSQSGSYLQPDIYEDHAHRFDSLDLRSFPGWRIKSIGIIPVDSHVNYYAAVWVKEGDEFVCVYQAPLTDTVLFEENIHEIVQDIFIERKKEYLVGYRVLCDPSLQGWSGYYNAIDSGPGNGKGNMSNNYFLGWESWPPDNNWCIHAVLESPAGEQLTMNQKDEETLTGYKVYRDGQLLETIDRRFQTYSFDQGFAIGETVSYSVTAMYGEFESEPVNITFTYDGLAESQAESPFVIYPNPTTGQFTVEGANVTRVEVYNLVGQKVHEAEGKSVSIDAAEWNKGIYLVNIVEQNGAVVTKKLVVK